MIPKRTIALLLCLTLSAAPLVSCSQGVSESPSESGAEQLQTQSETTAETETGHENVPDTLPELDFGGETITILTRGGEKDRVIELAADENTGDVVEDAVYARNLSVSERLNLNVEFIFSSDDRHTGTETNKMLRSAVMAGDDIYDLAGNHMSQSTPLILDGLLVNLNTVPYIDFDSVWWNQSFNKQLTLNDKLYFAVGDLSLTMLAGDYVMFFNRDMFSNLFPDDDIYSLVNDGDWTLDALYGYIDTVYDDLNGDGISNDGDRFGICVGDKKETIAADMFVGGVDLQFTARDSDGNPYFVLDNSRTYTFVDKVNSIFNHPTAVIKDGDERTFFKNGQVLFTCYLLLLTESMRDMEDDYGIIPMPKLDESQDHYAGYTHNGFSVFFIPITADDSSHEMSGAYLEATCAESYRKVTPAYYEVALKTKYAREDVSSQMLDLITQSIVFDFAEVYAASLDSVLQMFRPMFATGDPSAASKIASKLTKCETLLANILQTYAELP